MKFEKIIIPPGWQDSFTKYPNGRTIFEALSYTITTVNEGIEEVNQKVNQGLLDIEQAENTIRSEITESFNTLQSQLEGEIATLSSDLIGQWSLFQTSVNAQLAEKVQNFKIKNEITNGDFSSGISGWIGSGAILRDDSGKLEIKGRGTSALSEAYYELNTIIEANKFYISSLFKPVSPNIVRLSLKVGGVTSGTVLTTSKESPAVGAESRFSMLFTPTNQIGKLRLYLSNQYTSTSTALDAILLCDNVLVINLTQFFGVGNEPTKLEMDELMKVIPNGWWDGELTLTQKQFITWQLNLIRKNTNAIIALGGTII